jgi:glycine cleavage system H protein
MPHPADLKYTKDHEWIRFVSDTASAATGDTASHIAEIGITDFAQRQLGDVVYVDLPAVGATIAAGAAFGTIESVKAVSELFAPVSGTVVEVNPYLKDHPEAVNAKPHETWLIKLRVSASSDEATLLDGDQYERLIV